MRSAEMSGKCVHLICVSPFNRVFICFCQSVRTVWEQRWSEVQHPSWELHLPHLTLSGSDLWGIHTHTHIHIMYQYNNRRKFENVLFYMFKIIQLSVTICFEVTWGLNLLNNRYIQFNIYSFLFFFRFNSCCLIVIQTSEKCNTLL